MDQRNLILAIVFSVTILLAFQFLYEQPRMERERATREAAEQQQKTTQTLQVPTPGTVPGVQVPGPQVPGARAPDVQAPVTTAPSRAAVVGKEKRIRIRSERLHGTVALAGARIDDLTLADYRETIEDGSPEITLLSPPRAPDPYYAQFGWVAVAGTAKAPGPDVQWSADRAIFGLGKPVTLTWDNGEGVIFQQVITLDENYMFSVTQRVRNGSGKPVTLQPYGLISRTGTPDTLGFWILHEGLLGVFNETLKELDYDDVEDEGKIEQSSTGGWIGITDKYWLTALIPDQKATTASRFVHSKEDDRDKYQVDFLAPVQTIPAGAGAEITSQLFAGAKEVHLLDRYRDRDGIARFDLAVDWGWLWFLTKPIFDALRFFNGYIGNFGLSILFLTVLIKLAFFPLANKSYSAMSRMKKLQPKMMEIRERYKEDRARQNQEMMALYKTEKANPMAGCFPILIQIPVFFALYKVLFVTIEMRHTPFFGWIQDLSAPDPLGLLTAFGLIEWDVPQMLDIANIGIWPIIMGATMFLQQRLNPQPADPAQAKIFMMLPIVFTFLLGRFPAGLVIYWAWNNLLSITQQWVIMRRMGVTASGQTTTPLGGGAKKPAGSAKAGGAKAGSAKADNAKAGRTAAEGAGKRKGASRADGSGQGKRGGKRKRPGKGNG